MRFVAGLVAVLGLTGGMCGQEPPVRVSSGVLAGLLIAHPYPVYPDSVRDAGIDGAMVMRVIVGETGHVEQVQAVSGPEAMRPAAIEAVRHWVYKPYLVDGVARKVDTTVTISMQYGGGRAPCGTAQPWEPDFHVQVSSGTMAGQLLSRPDPVFPALPAHSHVSGATVMRVCISAQGIVEKVVPVMGPDVLRQTVIETLSRWRYRPYVVDGKAVPVATTVTLNIEFGGGL